MNNRDYRLQNVIDGLIAISASLEDKLYINHNFTLTVDEVFDHEPLDWLPSLVQEGLIADTVASNIVKLYQEINELTKNMDTEQEDIFIRSNDSVLKSWSSRAREILASIKC